MFLQFSYNFQYKRNKSENSTYDMPNGWTVPQGLAGNTDGVYNNDLSKNAVYDYYNHQVMICRTDGLQKSLNLIWEFLYSLSIQNLIIRKAIWIQ